jgi:hypothetical protein
VTEPRNVVLDLVVPPGVGCGGFTLGTLNGQPPTPEEIQERDDMCAGREFYPAPSGDGTPFEVVIVGPGLARQICLSKSKQEDCGGEFATYNLLTVRADEITFHPNPSGGILEATGNVIVYDGRREYDKASVKFMVMDGKAVEVP